MPQFDIASFYPQITFFTVIFLSLYVFLTKKILPKVSQNLKLSKKISDKFSDFSNKGLKDLNLLSYIYQPKKIVSYLIYKETLCLIYLEHFYLRTLTTSFISSLNWLNYNRELNTKVKLAKLNRTYLKTLNQIV